MVAGIWRTVKLDKLDRLVWLSRAREGFPSPLGKKYYTEKKTIPLPLKVSWVLTYNTYSEDSSLLYSVD